MTYLIKQDESNASRRVLYFWSVLSNGTSPAQFEAGGQPTVSVAGLPTWNSAGTLLSVNTTVGEYQVRLGTSDVSLLGPGLIRYSSTSAVETGIPFMVVGYDPYASLSTFNNSSDSVGLKAVTHSGATVAGLVSAITIGTGGIVAASFAASAIDAAALATDAGQEIADRILQRNIHGGSDSGRTVSEALAVLRNKVAVSGSAMTVYRENDTTAYWTASVTTVSSTSGILNSVDPA